MLTAKPKSIDEYLSGFPEDIRKILEEVRVTIRKAAPGAEEDFDAGDERMVNREHSQRPGPHQQQNRQQQHSLR